MEENLINIFSHSNLMLSWKRTKLKGSLPGIDGVSIQEFEKDLENNLSELQDSLFNKNYIPEPYKRIFIRKESNKFRPISIMSLKDRIVQNAVYLFYSEKFDKIFLDTSYAYRKKKGHAKSINRIQDFLARKYHFVSLFDIDNFFDTINRNKLFEKCEVYFQDPYIKDLIKMWVYTGVVYNENYVSLPNGIAQGSIISPLLSNLYLHDFDLAMKNKSYNSIRYADNIILLSKTKEEIIEGAKYSQNYLLEYLGLKLNNNPNIIEAKEGFSFCGIFFKDNLRRIDSKKFDSINKKITNLIGSNKLEDIPSKLNEHLQGINRYYFAFDTKDQIAVIEEIIADKLSKKLAPAIKEISINNLKNNLRKINFVSFRNNANKENLIKKIIYTAKEEGFELPDSENKQIKKAVTKKRSEYRKTWFSNLDLTISSNFARIGKSQNNFSVKTYNNTNQISIKNVKNILITGKGVSISSDAINLAASSNIRIDYFDSLGKPYASIIPSAAPLNSVSTAQLTAGTNSKAKQIIKELITAKIKNQLSVIKYFTKNKKEKSPLIEEETNRMENLLESINNMDFDLDIETFRSKVFGIEGSAAASYWTMFKQLTPDEYEFEKREHQNAVNIINIMLNYGYGILYTRVLSAITIAGLNPNISFLHKEQKGKPVLVFDLIEQFRAPAVDRTVIAILSKNIKITKQSNKLSEETRKIISEKFLLRLKAEFNYRNKTTSLNDEIIFQANHLVEFLNGKANKYKPFISKW